MLFEPEISGFPDIGQKFVVALEVFGETVFLADIFTGVYAVLPADVGTRFVDCAFVFARQKIAPRIHLDVPSLPVDIKRYVLVRDLP